MATISESLIGQLASYCWTTHRSRYASNKKANTHWHIQRQRLFNNYNCLI